MAITRIWQNGWETGSLLEVDGTSQSHNIEAATPKSGLWSCYTYPNNANNYHWKTIPATRQLRAATAWQCSGWGSSEGEIMIFRHASGVLIRLNLLNATKELRIKVNAATVDTTSGLGLVTDTYYHLVMDVKIHATAGWIKVYLNGTEILSYAGNTGDADAVRVDYGTYADQGGALQRHRWDDEYIDDTTGEGSAAPAPLLRFGYLAPNGNGNYSQWVGSDGNNVDNYALIDERPPSTADYVEEDTVDQFDSYAMTTYSIVVGEVVHALIPIVEAQRYGAAEEIALGTRYSAVDAIGSDQDPGFGAWDYTYERQTTKPGGGAWTQAAIDGVELVIKSRGTF